MPARGIVDIRLFVPWTNPQADRKHFVACATDAPSGTRIIPIYWYDMMLQKTANVGALLVAEDERYEVRDASSGLAQLPIWQELDDVYLADPAFLERLVEITDELTNTEMRYQLLVSEATGWVIITREEVEESAVEEQLGIEPATLEPDQIPTTGICYDRRYHRLSDEEAVVPVVGMPPWHLRRCLDCPAVFAVPPK